MTVSTSKFLHLCIRNKNLLLSPNLFNNLPRNFISVHRNYIILKNIICEFLKNKSSLLIIVPKYQQRGRYHWFRFWHPGKILTSTFGSLSLGLAIAQCSLRPKGRFSFISQQSIVSLKKQLCDSI